MKTGVRIAAALMLALSWSAAQAGDFCITASTFQIVGKSFKVPPPGKCKPFFGFFSTPAASYTTGQACTASNGSHVNFVLTTTETGTSLGFAEWDNVDLALPGGAGMLIGGADLFGALTTTSGVVVGAPCNVPVPIP
jgi:hypothetical protein